MEPRSPFVQALLYFFLEARRELPDEALIPTRIVLDDKVFDKLAALIESPSPPTEALRGIMRTPVR